MDFSEAIAAQIAGRSVKMSPLLRLDFLSGTQRYWMGTGDLPAGGHVWTGSKGLVDIGPVTAPVNGDAPEQTFTLSGVDEAFVTVATASKAEYYGRLCFIYFQFFDATDPNLWQSLDSPVAFWWGRMFGLKAALASEDDGFTQTLTLSAETVFASRRRPRNAYYTDRDQQARFPGDRGMERVLGMQSKLITSPDY